LFAFTHFVWTFALRFALVVRLRLVCILVCFAFGCVTHTVWLPHTAVRGCRYLHVLRFPRHTRTLRALRTRLRLLCRTHTRTTPVLPVAYTVTHLPVTAYRLPGSVTVVPGSFTCRTRLRFGLRARAANWVVLVCLVAVLYLRTLYTATLRLPRRVYTLPVTRVAHAVPHCLAATVRGLRGYGYARLRCYLCDTNTGSRTRDVYGLRLLRICSILLPFTRFPHGSAGYITVSGCTRYIPATLVGCRCRTDFAHGWFTAPPTPLPHAGGWMPTHTHGSYRLPCHHTYRLVPRPTHRLYLPGLVRLVTSPAPFTLTPYLRISLPHRTYVLPGGLRHSWLVPHTGFCRLPVPPTVYYRVRAARFTRAVHRAAHHTVTHGYTLRRITCGWLRWLYACALPGSFTHGSWLGLGSGSPSLLHIHTACVHTTFTVGCLVRLPLHTGSLVRTLAATRFTAVPVWLRGYLRYHVLPPAGYTHAFPLHAVPGLRFQFTYAVVRLSLCPTHIRVLPAPDTVPGYGCCRGSLPAFIYQFPVLRFYTTAGVITAHTPRCRTVARLGLRFGFTRLRFGFLYTLPTPVTLRLRLRTHHGCCVTPQFHVTRVYLLRCRG